MSALTALTAPYARTPGRAAWQVLGDLLLVLWVWLAWRAGEVVGSTVRTLAEPGRRLEEGADGVAGGLADAAEAAQRVPLVGDELSTPFSSAGDAAEAIAAAGRRQVEVVEDVATVLTVVVVAVPVLLALALWLPGRVRFTRRSLAARRFVDADADLALFALRAMANQPMHKLARVSEDPVTAWRSGDVEVVRALAELELRDCGLTLPRRAVTAP